jgi:hypothetical protein
MSPHDTSPHLDSWRLEMAASDAKHEDESTLAKKPMRVYRASPNSTDLVITNQDPNPKHPYRRIDPDDPRYAELLPLVQDLYVPPWGYADNIFLLGTDDTSKEGLKELAEEAGQLTRDYFDKHGIPHKFGDSSDGPTGDNQS